MMTQPIISLRKKIAKLADKAFHQHLISGYGDGENINEYQLVIHGKPRHYSLEYTYSFLQSLLDQKN